MAEEACIIASKTAAEEVDLIAPWEKQANYPVVRSKILPTETSPVRKSFSYAGFSSAKQSGTKSDHERTSIWTLFCNKVNRSENFSARENHNTCRYSFIGSCWRPFSSATSSAFIRKESTPMKYRCSSPLMARIAKFRASPQSDSVFAIADVRFISQEEARHIDEELFSEYAFSVDQLMELAGLSCAASIQFYLILSKMMEVTVSLRNQSRFCSTSRVTIWESISMGFPTAYPLSSMPISRGRVLILCGPGNNGGDGLVCARHLSLFGYTPTVYYPQPTPKELYQRLVVQCEKIGIAFLSYIPSDAKILESSYDLMVDSLFGFGFRPPLKPEFAEVVQRISNLKLPLISIDVPSGWEMTEKTNSEDQLQPDCLISLTAPKLCARRFNGRFHFLGGRFIPPALAHKYELNLPEFPASSPFVQLECPAPPLPCV